MKTVLKQIVVLGALLALTGCGTSGLSRRERPGITYPAYIMSLQPDAAASSRREIKFPLRIAVTQAGETAPDYSLLRKLEGSKALIRSVASLPALADTAPEYTSASSRLGANM